MKILITGGTGSFGTKMIEKMIDSDEVDVIRVFSRDEKKQHDMRVKFNSPKIEFFIGDIRDKESVSRGIEGMDTIFHAAALKQVPTGEFFPEEMIKTNINGASNLISAVRLNGNIKKVILLSTDKAVFPINTMGLSKAVAEKLFQAAAKTSKETIFNVVRYGNVMASRGSVIPLFAQKIISDSVLPITDPDMTRFLLSLDDAIDLVLYAIKNGKQGDTFVRKAPSVTVATLAEAMGMVFNKKIKTEIIGPRAGEKKHETLLTSAELSRAEEQEHYFRVLPETENLAYDKFYSQGVQYVPQSDFTSESTKILNTDETIVLLKTLDFIKELENTRI